MEAFLLLILLGWIILLFVVFPVWVIAAVRRIERNADEARGRMNELESRIAHLQQQLSEAARHTPPPSAPEPAPSEAMRPVSEAEAPSPAARTELPPPPRRTPPPFVPPPPEAKQAGAARDAAAPSPGTSHPPARLNWERFMGVNLFAWIGGFVLFLAAAFFVKYSIDNNLISPAIRIVIGFLLGAGLLAGGLRLAGRDSRVTAHTLCATGIVILYADIYAAHTFYGFIGQAPAFLFMALTTSAAILLAIRLEAKVVAILGLLGGFLTPPLLSTGEDHPLGLFGYVAFLDAGLILVALNRRWPFLVLLAAMGTVLMQIGWADRFFEPSKVFVAMGIFFSFQAVFLAAFAAAVKRDVSLPAFAAAAILIPAATLAFLSYLLWFRELGSRPLTLFLFGLVSGLCLMALALRRPSLQAAHRLAGLYLFFLLATWTFVYLTPGLLYHGLSLYMAFALLHAAFPLLLQKRYRETAASGWDLLFAPFALALAMIPVFRFAELSPGFWCVVLLMDFLIAWIAIAGASLALMIAALILSMLSIFAWLLKMPASVAALPEFIGVTAVFSAFFFGAGALAAKAGGESIPADKRAQVPALSCVMPFLLLILASLHLPLDNPTPVFGLALFLAVLLLGLSRMVKIGFLSIICLLCVVALEVSWHGMRFKADAALTPLIWYLVFYGVFAVYPFLFHKEEQLSPWIASALSGPLHYYLIHGLVKAAYPNPAMGLLPAAFSIPSLAGLLQRWRTLPEDAGSRNAQLAWFGGATLFFLTLIFPVQFERQWVLIGWALEGVALLWLFHRVRHAGLRIVGVGLLVVAFLGLVNPGFFLEHPRSARPILNWYMYTYGIVAASLMAAGKLLDVPRNRIGSVNVQAFLYALGTLLAFLLMNLEIADYYSTGPILAFQFSGNFARDMTYSIAWALFAFGLLIAGIRRNLPAARYGSMLLLVITVLKLFFHDLAALKQLYRVGALVGVSVILILASYLYQRFVSFEPEQEKKE